MNIIIIIALGPISIFILAVHNIYANLSSEDLQCACNWEVRITVVVGIEISNKGCK